MSRSSGVVRVAESGGVHEGDAGNVVGALGGHLHRQRAAQGVADQVDPGLPELVEDLPEQGGGVGEGDAGRRGR
jgi:hypothetical protein